MMSVVFVQACDFLHTSSPKRKGQNWQDAVLLLHPISHLLAFSLTSKGS